MCSTFLYAKQFNWTIKNNPFPVSACPDMFIYGSVYEPKRAPVVPFSSRSSSRHSKYGLLAPWCQSSSYGPWSAPALLCLKNHENGTHLQNSRCHPQLYRLEEFWNPAIARCGLGLPFYRNSSPNHWLGFFLLSVCVWFGGRTSLVVSSPVHNALFVDSYLPVCMVKDRQ